MTPIERDRELSHRALLRYLKACGFRQQETGEEQAPPQQRFNRRKTTIEVWTPGKHAYAYTLATAKNGEKFETRSPLSIMTHIERLLDGGEITEAREN